MHNRATVGQLVSPIKSNLSLALPVAMVQRKGSLLKNPLVSTFESFCYYCVFISSSSMCAVKKIIRERTRITRYDIP